ncbi:Phage T7 exclusion protein [Fibrella aestuarina BUZ 2]|uniref:Phage T7 exclusion protein n=1 Tax=Fibrella aestuarina BUZ 2 TaxID=1166018 RepID=I0KCU6_9BACT|nr:phage T7 exclusion protein [Fibrella aestuarina]CCH01949.1 Phage T7 exclusion protein [Fibrella aestuarina BUZ 2]
MENKENYTADKPVDSSSEDAFQRYGFAKRIAETIVTRKDANSIVFGIFGAWGEGKTSVINFIYNEISNADGDCIQITFNPWRFTDEAALLISFFNKLASELKKHISYETAIAISQKSWVKRTYEKITKPEDQPLKTASENIGELIQKYGKTVSIFGVGDAAETIGKAIANTDLDVLKERIEKLLAENKKRIIIYIDDIDRLEKSEIHSIFRLVKLTGNFLYTTYVLSFDQDMVASAIGERFGSGDKRAGENFIEKIIQVPLNIPKAQPDALKKFCFELVDKVLESADISLSENDVQRFVLQFTSNILPQLSTPRLAVRYGNSLSFYVPLLKGEVNMVDLLLVEALRIFYPEHYFFVKENSSVFLKSYNSPYNRYNNESLKADAKAQLDELNKKSKKIGNSDVSNLLGDLFPNLNAIFSAGNFYSGSTDDWYLQKRIASPKYFDRYFSYTVVNGDVSDVEFDLFLSNLETIKNGEEVAQVLRKFLETSTADNLIYKIRSYENKLKWSSAKGLVRGLCVISTLLPNEKSFLGFGFGSPFSQAAIFIHKILENNKAEGDLYTFVEELMSQPVSFDFSYEINYWLRAEDATKDKLFSNDEFIRLAEVLTQRAVDEAGQDSIFVRFEEYVHFLGPAWYQRDPVAYRNYIMDYLAREPKNVASFLKAFTPTVRSTSRPEPFKGDLSKERYDNIVQFIDRKILFEKIASEYSIDELNKEQPYWDNRYGNVNTEMNMLRQFLHWYDLEKGASIN